MVMDPMGSQAVKQSTKPINKTTLRILPPLPIVHRIFQGYIIPSEKNRNGSGAQSLPYKDILGFLGTVGLFSGTLSESDRITKLKNECELQKTSKPTVIFRKQVGKIRTMDP